MKCIILSGTMVIGGSMGFLYFNHNILVILYRNHTVKKKSLQTQKRRNTKKKLLILKKSQKIVLNFQVLIVTKFHFF